MKMGYRKLRLLFCFDVLYNIIVIIVLCMGCISNLIDRLEKVKFKNIVFSVVGIDVFNKVCIIRRFLRIVMI